MNIIKLLAQIGFRFVVKTEDEENGHADGDVTGGGKNAVPLVAFSGGVAGGDQSGEIGAEELSETEKNQHKQALSSGAHFYAGFEINIHRAGDIEEVVASTVDENGE